MLNGSIETITSPGCRGCLGVIASVDCSDGASPIREEVITRARSARLAIVERLQRGIDEGDFPLPVDAETITLYLTTVLQGLSVQASSGATRAQLQQVAAATLAVWPSR